jgi:hypothetical protein
LFLNCCRKFRASEVGIAAIALQKRDEPDGFQITDAKRSLRDRRSTIACRQCGGDALQA